jgi:hypothetical protein
MYGRVPLYDAPETAPRGGTPVMPMAPKARRPGPDAVARSAAQRAAKIAPVIAEIRASGAKTLQAIADGLNARRIPTRLNQDVLADAGGARSATYPG